MAQDTFAQLWNRVLLYAPSLPPFLAQRFIKNAHQRLIDSHYWSELKVDGGFNIPTWYTTGTVAWTAGGTTVTGTGTLWNTGTNVSLYQQIQLGNQGNYYTITAIGSDTSITVDRAISEASSSGESYHIGQLYIEMPQNFGVFEVVRDESNEWKLTTQFFNQEYLDRIDPNRTATGTPTLVVYANPRIDSSGNMIPRIEVWPAPSSSTNYIYRYRKESSLSASTDRGLAVPGADCYIWAALAELALWPGTDEKENRFFSIDLHRKYEDMFQERLNDAVVNDHDLDQRMITYGMGEERAVPIDAKYIQSHGL